MDRDILRKIVNNFENKKGFISKIFNSHLLNKLEYKDYFDRFDETCVFMEFCKYHSPDDILKLLNKMDKADVDLSYNFDQYTRYDAKLFENLLNEIDSNKMEIIINKLPEPFFRKKFDEYNGFARFRENLYKHSKIDREALLSFSIHDRNKENQKYQDLKKEMAKKSLSKMSLLRDKIYPGCIEHLVMERSFEGSFIKKDFTELYLNLEKEDQLKLISMLDLKNSDWMVFFERVQSDLKFADEKTENNLKLIIQHINQIGNKSLTGKMLLSYLNHWENDPHNAKNKDIGYSVQEIAIFNTIVKENEPNIYKNITYPNLIKEIIAEKPESSIITGHEKVAIQIILKDLFNLSNDYIEKEVFKDFIKEALDIYPELFSANNLSYIDEQFKKIKMHIVSEEHVNIKKVMICEHSFDSDESLGLNVLNLALKIEDENLINKVASYYQKNKMRLNESQLFDLYYYTTPHLIEKIKDTFITKSDHTSFFIMSEDKKIKPYYKDEIISLHSYVNFISNRREVIFKSDNVTSFIDINLIIKNGSKNEKEYGDRIIDLYNELTKMKNHLGEDSGQRAYSRGYNKENLNRKILNFMEKELKALYEKEVIGDIINSDDSEIQNKIKRRL